MTSGNLTREQIDRLATILGRQLRFQNRLCARMHKLKFPMDDPLLVSALAAREAVRKLYEEAYSAGRPQARPPGTVVTPR